MFEGENAGLSAGMEVFEQCVNKITLCGGYSTPCASMASATLTNPAMLAPCT